MTQPQSPTLSLEEDVRILRQTFEKAGYFSKSAVRTLAEMAAFLALFGASFAVATSHPLAALAFLTVLTVHVGWWIHEAGHDAVFLDRGNAKRAVDFFGILFLGMPQASYHFHTHRRHHGLSNVIGRDGAIETGPIVWDHAQEAQPKIPAALQPFAWFVGVLPFTFFYMAAGVLRDDFRARRYLAVALTAARWIFLLAVLRQPALAIIPTLVCCSFVGTLASLSHFHLPMRTEARRGFLANVFESTQNISLTSPLWTWASGGLNFHVEHHLFPQMPSRHYPRISAEIRALAARHQLPFHEDSLAGVLARVWKRLETRQPQVSHEKAA